MVLAITCGLSDPFLAVATIRPQKERASSKLILEAVKVCAKSVISEFHSESTSISLSQPFFARFEKKNLKQINGKKKYINTSVQAEIFLLPAPTFLEGFYLNFHMPGHFDL